CTLDELQLWDVAKLERLEVWRAPSRTRSRCRLIFSPDGKRLVLTGRGEAVLAAWDLPTGQRIPLGRPPKCFPDDVAFRGGRIIGLCCLEQRLNVWDVTSGERFDREAGHGGAIDAVVVRRGRICTASGHHLLEWDLSGRPLGALPDA